MSNINNTVLCPFLNNDCVGEGCINFRWISSLTQIGTCQFFQKTTGHIKDYGEQPKITQAGDTKTPPIQKKRQCKKIQPKKAKKERV